MSALVFGAATTDVVNHGSAASLDNLNPFTWLAWVKQITATANRLILSKSTLTTAKILIATSATLPSNVQLAVGRATVNSSFITSNTPLAADTWTCLAATYDSSVTPVGHVYSGTLAATMAEATYTTNIDGSGAVSSDAALSFRVGNGEGTGNALSFIGSIGLVAVWNRVLTLAELKAQQFSPRATSGCVLFCREGWAGASGTQPDMSGNGNSGSPSGVTLGAGVPLRQPVGMDTFGFVMAAAAPSSYLPITRRTLTGVGG